jgi:Spy/CpxP family protein refolding chaperone
MFSRKILFGSLGIILALAMVVLAQQTLPQTPETVPDGTVRRDERQRPGRHRDRMGRDKGMGRRGGGMSHLLRELNLTDEQQQQSRAIVRRRLESTKSQREELFQLREKRIAGTFTAEDGARAKALHQELRASMEGVRTEMEGVLTAEQKARLEELKKERKEKLEQRLKEREEFLNKNPR